MVNRVILIGRLGRDPEVRRLDSGAAVGKFTVATDESYKDKEGNKIEQTEWHNIVVWRTQAEIAEKYLKKGMLVYIEGKLTHREYVDKESGQKKYFTEVVANNFRMLESRREGGGGGYFPQEDSTEGGSSAAAKANEPATATADNGGGDSPADDLPF